MRVNGPWRAVQSVADALRPVAGGHLGSHRRRALTDWARPLTLANAHLVAPAIYARLAAADRLDDLPPDVREYLALLHRLNGERNDALRAQATEAIAALNAAGVVPMLLKGALALFVGLHRDPAARMIRDIDILVLPECVNRAAEALDALGYRMIARYEAGHNAYGDFARPHDPGALDLHTELVEMPYLLRAADVWRRARALEAAPGAVFFAPAPTDMALHHVLHAQVHYLGNFYRGILELRQLYEFAVLVDLWRDIDWPDIHQHLRQHRLEVALESYALAAQRLLGAPWPLSHPPSKRAVLHCRRCLVQLAWPALGRLGLAVANLRAAFAWHRMNDLHAQTRSLLVQRLKHALLYFHKTAPRDAIGRLFRVS